MSSPPCVLFRRTAPSAPPRALSWASIQTLSRNSTPRSAFIQIAERLSMFPGDGDYALNRASRVKSEGTDCASGEG